MFSFLLCFVILIAGYFIYGKFVERKFAPDNRHTPAITMQDGVDYVVLPQWRIFLIQLLNIAGLGPIWGAIGGAMWGSSVFLWITLGTLLAGGVHDFASGFISLRNEGKSISEVCGHYMGNGMRNVMRILSIILMFMVGVAFAQGPAGLLSYLFYSNGVTDGFLNNTTMWLLVIIVYYFIATFVPVDKIIGKIYPVFGCCLLIMALGVLSGIFVQCYADNIPELWDVLGKNMHPSGTSAWPMMFISVACGAISGFHSTQSPIMARCIKSEKQAHQIFYGAMVCEGIIALIWAGAACALFPITDGKMTGLETVMASGQASCVYKVCAITMSKLGIVLAMLGVIICPITSGDTAFRSARLTLADWFHIDQKSWKNRFALTAPLLILCYLVCQLDYSKVWNYLASTNQILAMIVLWMAAMYLLQNHQKPWIAVVPATFMSYVTMTCVLSSDLYLGKIFGAYATRVGNIGGLVVGTVFLLIFLLKYKGKKQRQQAQNP